MKFLLGMAVVCVACAAAGQARDADVMSVLPLVSHARTTGCRGQEGTREPLHWSDAASRAALRIDRGEPALAALEREGMRATRVFQASFSGYRAPADVANALVQHHCAAIHEPRFTQFGIHRDGNRWRVVMAAPLELPQLADRRAAVAKVLALTNAARAAPRRCGDRDFDAAPPVRWNPRLEEAASLHAQDMASHVYLDHRGRDGSTPAQRVMRAGYGWRSVGENVASGQMSAEDVVDDWLRSPGHCANLMSPDFSEMGAGYAVNMNAAAVVYWAQNFGRPR